MEIWGSRDIWGIWVLMDLSYFYWFLFRVESEIFADGETTFSSAVTTFDFEKVVLFVYCCNTGFDIS